MLLHDSRRAARLDEAGEIVVLEDQDRTKWNQIYISEALPLVDEALRGEPGQFALEAAISAEHCRAAIAEDTNWRRIIQLYNLLERLTGSPIVSLNRAVAVAMADGPPVALELIDQLADDLDDYHLFHAARADLHRRMGAKTDAAAHYRRALELVTNESERRFLEGRLQEVES